MSGLLGSAISRREVLMSGAVAAAAATPVGAALKDHAEAGGIGARIEQLRQRYKLPAVGVAATLNGSPVFTEAYGSASLPFAVSANTATLFHTGSVGKHVTAAGVLKLLERRALSVDEPVGKYVKSLPFDWGQRTIRSLLTHTSGIPDYEEGFDWDRPFTRDSFLKLSATRASNFTPGTSWAYSNTGYVLLGFLIEDLSGKSYREFITTEVLKPAGLRDSQVDEAEALISNRAEPYIVDDSGTRHATRMNSGVSGMPDGGILMSTRDFAQWNHAIDSGPTLSDAGRRLMFTPVELQTGRSAPYGFGWRTEELGPRRPFYWHAGSVPGFIAFTLKSPTTGLNILILSNAGSSSLAQRHIGQEVAEALAPGSTPYSLKPIADRDQSSTSAARALLYRGKAEPDRGSFGPEMRALLDGPIGLDAVPNLTSRGHPDSFELVQETRRLNGHVRRYRLRFGDRLEHLSFGYTPDRRIYWIGAI